MPKVIITDKDNTMISAIGDIFPESIHQICSWHKSQNFKKHLLSITKTIGKSKELSEEKEKRVILYNTLINLPYCRSKDPFQQNLKSGLSSDYLSKDQKKYLEDCKILIEKWCYAFKKVTRNLGTNESNRVECVNKYLKKMIKSSQITITELIVRFLQFENKFNKIDNIFMFENQQILDFKLKAADFPIIKNFRSEYSQYSTIKFINNYWLAQNLFFEQKTKKAKYFEIQKKEAKDDLSYCVNFSNPIMECSCSYVVQWGISCQHIICVKIFLQDDSLVNMPIDPRSKKRVLDVNKHKMMEELVKFLTTKIEKEKESSKIDKRKGIKYILAFIFLVDNLEKEKIGHFEGENKTASGDNFSFYC